MAPTRLIYNLAPEVKTQLWNLNITTIYKLKILSGYEFYFY